MLLLLLRWMKTALQVLLLHWVRKAALPSWALFLLMACIRFKSGQTNTCKRPRTLIAFVTESLSAVIHHYHRTIGSMCDSLYNMRQMRDSDMTLDRVYSMLSEFLIEVKLSEEQDKIAQTVTGAEGTQMKPTEYDEYVNANRGKIQKGKGKGTDAKGLTENWPQPCSDCWKPDGCNLGHLCPKYHLHLVDAPSVVQQSTTPLSASAPSSPSPRTSSMTRTTLGCTTGRLG